MFCQPRWPVWFIMLLKWRGSGSNRAASPARLVFFFGGERLTMNCWADDQNSAYANRWDCLIFSTNMHLLLILNGVNLLHRDGNSIINSILCVPWEKSTLHISATTIPVQIYTISFCEQAYMRVFIDTTVWWHIGTIYVYV